VECFFARHDGFVVVILVIFSYLCFVFERMWSEGAVQRNALWSVLWLSGVWEIEFVGDKFQ
jgi:hypothetical protein